MEKRRVVITGMGAVTPIGNNVETFWKNVKEGKNGIGSITKFDTTDYKVKIAAGAGVQISLEDFIEK